MHKHQDTIENTKSTKIAQGIFLTRKQPAHTKSHTHHTHLTSLNRTQDTSSHPHQQQERQPT